MCTLEQIDHAVEVLGTENILSATAHVAYPAQCEELNLARDPTLQAERYDVPVGYSGHETGLADHARRRRARRLPRRAPHHPRPRDVGLRPGRVRRAERASCAWSATSASSRQSLGDGVKKVLPSEVPVMQKLRRVGL